MRALILAALMLLPQVGAAGVFMCVDPVTGKKTFTDKACPKQGTGEKVKIQTTNFGQGVVDTANRGTWKSHRDTSRSGREHAQADRERSKRGLADAGTSHRNANVN